MTVSNFQLSAVAQFGQLGDTRYFFADASIESNTELFGMYGLAVYGFKGGVYVNMSKEILTASQQSIRDNISNKVLDPTPGYGLSDYKYKVSSGSFGLRAGIIMGLQGSPNVICGDVEFGIEMKLASSKLSVTKITIDGGVYLMAPSLIKREEAGISAKAQLVINFEKGLLNGKLTTKVNLPTKKLNYIDGGGTSFFQVDINPLDNNTHKDYVTIGTPNNPLSFTVKITDDIKVVSKAYFMMGEYPENTTNDKFRIAFGFEGSVPKKTIDVWPFKGSYEGKIKMDGVFSTTNVPDCSNYSVGDNYGINGKYLKAKVTAKFRAKASIAGANILNGSLDASLTGGLPNPTKINGSASLKARIGTIPFAKPCWKKK